MHTRIMYMSCTHMISPGLESIEMSHDKDNPGQNRGFCFLDYKNQQCAIAAMRTLKEFRYVVGVLMSVLMIV